MSGTPTWNGVGNNLQTAVEDHPFTFSIDKDGVSRAEVTFSISFDQAIQFAVEATGTYLSLASFMLFAEATVNREEAGLAKVRVRYEGISPNVDEQTKYRLRAAGSKEPIETHPDFSTVATTSNAEFDADGNFVKFKTTLAGGADNPKAGQKSYYAPTMVYEETKVFSSRNAVNLNAKRLQKIDTPPNSEVLPTIAEGESWLLNKFDAEPFGDGIRLKRAWLKSGPRGWDTDWYTYTP